MGGLNFGGCGVEVWRNCDLASYDTVAIVLSISLAG